MIAVLLLQLSLAVSGILASRLLGVEDRGRLALLVLFGTIVTQLGTLGMPLSVTYWVASKDPDAEPLLRGLRGLICRQIVAIVVVQGVIVWIVFRDATGTTRLSAVISLIATPAAVLWQYALALLQGEQRFRSWNACRLSIAFGYTVMLGVCGIVGERHLPIVVAGWALVVWVGALCTLWAAGNSIRWRSRRSRLRDELRSGRRAMIGFGLRSLLGSASPLQGFNLDQALVGVLLSPRSLGYYVVAVAFTNLPFFIAQSVGAEALSKIAASTDRLERWRVVFRSFAAVLFISTVLVVAMEIAMPWLIVFLFGQAFRPAVPIARILVVYALLVALRRVLGDCARGLGHPGISTVDEMAALGCVLPAVLVLDQHGDRGVALAMVICAAIGLSVVVTGLFQVRLSERRETLRA